MGRLFLPIQIFLLPCVKIGYGVVAYTQKWTVNGVDYFLSVGRACYMWITRLVSNLAQVQILAGVMRLVFSNKLLRLTIDAHNDDVD